MVGRTLRCGDRVVGGARTAIMGIVNVTPDSFSDGGRYAGVDAAIDQALALLDAGADVVDIGGESTGPGAVAVPPAVELQRVLPVIEGLVSRGVRAISIDTRHASTARAALAAGASWVNDVSGLADPLMAEAASAADALVIMHWAEPLARAAAEDDVVDDDIVASVTSWLQARVARAVVGGVERARIVVDPGVGFGKTLAHNLALSRRLGALTAACDVAAVLYGPSRKRFIGALTGRDAPADRDAGTVGAVCAAIAGGADIVRVHDVAMVRDAVVVADAILRGRP